MLFGSKRNEEIKNLIVHLDRIRLRTIYLVNDHNRLQVEFKGFAQHKLGLRHRAFKGVNKKQHTINHLQDTLYLTAKVGMAGCIDNVDFMVFIDDRCVL